MDSALSGGLRASPSDRPAQAPRGVGCVQRPSHEHERPAPRLRVRSFPANTDPAGNTTSADFSTASQGLSTPTVPHHPANQKDGASGTPAEISTSKTSNLHRTPTAFTERPLDDIGLRLVVQTRPSRPALYAQPIPAPRAKMRHVFLGSRLRTPASSPPSLTTEQLPSACGWCHQPPQGTRTPELLVMSRAHRACGFSRTSARSVRSGRIGEPRPAAHHATGARQLSQLVVNFLRMMLDCGVPRAEILLDAMKRQAKFR
jgi:hypothetical protein